MNVNLSTDKAEIKKGETVEFHIVLTEPSSTALTAQLIPSAEIFPDSYLEIDLNSFSANCNFTIDNSNTGIFELTFEPTQSNSEITFNATAMKNFDKNTAAVIVYDSCNEVYSQTTLTCSTHNLAFVYIFVISLIGIFAIKHLTLKT